MWPIFFIAGKILLVTTKKWKMKHITYQVLFTRLNSHKQKEVVFIQIFLLRFLLFSKLATL